MIESAAGDLPSWKLALDATAILVSAGVAIFVWHARRNQAKRQELDAIEKQMAAMEVELKTLERVVAEMPSGKAIGGIANNITRIEGVLETMAAQMKGGFGTSKAQMDGLREVMGGIAKAVDRHEDHLLNKGR